MSDQKSTTDIVASVRKIVGPGKVALHDPMISRDEFFTKVSQGSLIGYEAIDELTAKVAIACGTEQALLTASGTTALHLALIVVGVAPFTEVLVPTLTFVGTANAVSHCGAIPNFVDSREYDFGINPFKLGRYLSRICEKRETGFTHNRQSGRRISALIAVDLLGVPCDIEAIKAEAGRWGIPVIEDAAQALGSINHGKPCGSGAFIGVVSFNNNKIVTTNGGGALVTDDPFMIAKAWSLATTARIKHPWKMYHSEVAYNYRMGNINAALGLPQIDRLDRLVELKNNLFRAYDEELGSPERGTISADSRSNRWLTPYILPQLDHRRDEILNALYAEGISARTLFTPIHDLPMYKHCPRDNLEEAQSVWRRTICLPSSPQLGEKFS